MRRRHLPRAWLMTDERMGAGLWSALARVPRGGGVVFRHYATPPDERRRVLARVARVARRRGLMLVVGGDRPPRTGDGVHNPRRVRPGRAATFAAHSRREALAAVRRGADAVFVSPVFATRSHPGAGALGAVRLGLLLRGLAVPAIALGGMDARRFRRVRRLGAYGWAGIDAWTDVGRQDQKRKAVPR